MSDFPKHFKKMREHYGEVMDKLKELGEATDKAGPIDVKTAHLIQIAAAAAMRSEGAVHSHTRRALKAGVPPEEIRHAVLLTLPTIGYPNMAAAMSWVEDILD